MTSLDTEAIFSPLGEELNHIKAVFITLVRSKTWKDVEQWVSWQQGTAADLLAVRNESLLLTVSPSHVF